MSLYFFFLPNIVLSHNRENFFDTLRKKPNPFSQEIMSSIALSSSKRPVMTITTLSGW